MSIRTAICHYLNSLPGLANLVGDRISPVIADRGETMPRVRYLRAGDKRERGLDVDVNDSGTLNLILAIEANRYGECDAIEAIIRGDRNTPALDGLHGEIGAEGDRYFVRAIVEDATDSADAPQHNDAQWIARTELQVTILYERSYPGE